MTTANDVWVWIAASVIHAVHDEQLREHGGSSGLREQGLLESELARPQQLAAYGEPDAAALAAAYGFSLAKNHPFLDGNKRTAFVVLELFLALNGFAFKASDAECVMAMLQLAACECTEDQFADWVRKHSARDGSGELR